MRSEPIYFIMRHHLCCCMQGLITVNGNQVDQSHEIRNGDFIVHLTLRTEPPVSDHAVHYHKVQAMPGVVIVNKPATMPIHACGPYKYNTVVGILGDAGLKSLHTVHRIDRWAYRT